MDRAITILLYLCLYQVQLKHKTEKLYSSIVDTLKLREPERRSTHQFTTVEPHIRKTVTISPKPSILKRTGNQKLTEHQSIQTIPEKDFKDTSQNNIIGLFSSDDHTNHNNLETTTECKSMKNKISFANRHCIMKNDLQDEIMKWYKDTPLYLNVSLSEENLRQQIIVEFIEKIYEHTNKEYTEDDYENIIKREIDDLLNTLKCPEKRESQEFLKDNMKNDLLIKIKNLRSKLYYLTVNFQTDDPVKAKPYTIASYAFQNEHINKHIENDITDWLMQIKFEESDDIGKKMSILDTADILVRRLLPFLNKSACTRNHKLVLKSLILNTLNSLPNIFQYPKNKRLYFNRLAEELTNRLVYIKVKYMNSNSFCYYSKDRKINRVTINSNSNIKQTSFEGLDSDVNNINLYPRLSVFEDVTNILLDYIESINFENSHTNNETNNTTYESQKIVAADATVKNIRDVLTEDILQNAQYSNIATNTSYIFSPMSIFKSEQDLSGQSNFPVTSTPKRKRTKKEIIKQNPEEIAYTKKVSELIQTWMDTLPKNFNDDKKFKGTVIMDLAGDIVDQIKMQQLIPVDESDKNKMMYYIIFRWLYRFDIFEDELSEDIPQIRDLQNQLNQLSVTNLTRPRHGNRQIMANTKFKQLEHELFVPSGIDVLEDEISIWMNEQPSHIYSNEDKSNRDVMVKELAKLLQSHLVNKNQEKNIETDINIWLKKILNTSAKKNIDNLTEALKNRIVKLPQDDTLAKILEVKIQRKLQSEAACLNPVQASIITNNSADAEPNIDTDETMKEFITKYMDHNYDVDDIVARAAFGELLKREIRKLSPPTRKEVYDNFTKQHEKLSPDRLDKELQYIKIISDWLKNIPIENSFNTPHNKKRIEIVNDLARNIYEIEEERSHAPTAMDYDMYLASIVSQFTNILPIPPEHRGHVMFMIDELIDKIVSIRTPMPCCSNLNDLRTTNTTRIPEQDICELIHSYIHLKSAELSDDQMKLDAWSARLMKEVKKIVQSTADPSTLCKAQVYDKFQDTPIPQHEYVRLFSLKLGYAKEISDWLKNLPLLPLQSQEANEERVKMITELAEKFSEWEKSLLINSSDRPINAETNEYITSWIRRIPIDPNKQIDIPILISQLLRRIERVNKGIEEAIFLPNTSETSLSKKSKSTSIKKRLKTQKCAPFCCSSGKGPVGKVIVDAIENWSKNLPIKSDNKDIDMSIKDDIARKLYQTIGDLSVDPQVMKDNDLFRELFADEVDSQLNKITKQQDIQKKKNVLKNELIDKVMEGKSIIKEAFAGENYKLQLENTIECSLPNPKINTNQWYDPAFEIYKNRLADIFILENFDHGNNAVKRKYDRKIREEIDKYFQSVQKRNAIPISKDEIYNELYSALFKVPIPNETSAIAEVEEVKTRCEIDLWFEGLPLREAMDLNQLLECDKILTMLAKRLHEIEKFDKNHDDKMHKEIVKWVLRFPLLQGQEVNVDKFADDLQNKLKVSKEDRKCITSFSKGKQVKKDKKHKDSPRNMSQIAGPSSEGQKWISPTSKSQSCCQLSAEPQKKPTELILEIVEEWCNKLPLSHITTQDAINNKIIRDKLLTQIIIKICALNGNPQTFNDDILYEHYLDAELENLLSKVPICCNFDNVKNSLRPQLIKSIISILPLMREEKACYEYKNELKTTISHVLQEPLNTTAQKIAMFNKLKDEIVDNYVQYHYNREDDELKQIYKDNLHEVVSTYLQNIKNKSDDYSVTPLMKENQLICELAKVPIPCERVIKDEVEEIKMKEEVKDFLDHLSLPDVSEDKMTLRNNIKIGLSKRLNEIERNSHNSDKDSKMKKEIQRYLKKLDLDIAPDKIESFVKKLKDNEAIRKAPPVTNKSIVRNSTNKLKSMANLNVPNTMQNCGLQECSDDRQIFGGPSEYRYIREGIPLTTSPIYNEVQQQQLNNQTLPNPTAVVSQNRQHSSNQPQRHALGQNTVKLGLNSDEADHEACICEWRMNQKFRRRPRCAFRLEEYCEDYCDQFRRWMSMPYRIPPPRYYYY